MGFRFRKTIKVLPGVKLNLSKSGISTTLGKRGAALNIGKRGVKGTVGIPGSGMFYQKQLLNSKGKPSRAIGGSSAPAIDMSNVDIAMSEDGKVVFLMSGHPITDSKTNSYIFREHADDVEQFIKEYVHELNMTSEQINNINQYFQVNEALLTPHIPRPYPEQPPEKPTASFGGWVKGLFSGGEKNEYEHEWATYEANKNTWDENERQFAERHKEFIRMVQEAAGGIQGVYEDMMEFLFSAIPSPLDFTGKYEIQGGTLFVDIDLPEIEDIPNEIYVERKRGFSTKQKSNRAIEQEYNLLVTGIPFILASHVFTLLPHIQEVVFSGYTQRLNVRTGHIENHYILSTRMQKQTFGQLRLENIDPVEAIQSFNTIGQIKAGRWIEITPH